MRPARCSGTRPTRGVRYRCAASTQRGPRGFSQPAPPDAFREDALGRGQPRSKITSARSPRQPPRSDPPSPSGDLGHVRSHGIDLLVAEPIGVGRHGAAALFYLTGDAIDGRPADVEAGPDRAPAPGRAERMAGSAARLAEHLSAGPDRGGIGRARSTAAAREQAGRRKRECGGACTPPNGGTHGDAAGSSSMRIASASRPPSACSAEPTRRTRGPSNGARLTISTRSPMEMPRSPR